MSGESNRSKSIFLVTVEDPKYDKKERVLLTSEFSTV